MPRYKIKCIRILKKKNSSYLEAGTIKIQQTAKKNLLITFANSLESDQAQ